MWHVILVILLATNACCESQNRLEYMRFWNEIQNNPNRPGLDEVLNYRAIFPCTKWCGPGHSATNHDELGFCSEADKCCREHDNCSSCLNPGETNYGLTNRGPYSKLSCECDYNFFMCLKRVDSYISSILGYVYFDMLGDREQKCFSSEHPAHCARFQECNKDRCDVYAFNVTEPSRYQWFHLPRFNKC